MLNIFTSDTLRDDCAWRTRVFAPTFGYLEDPATGSGNAALGYHLRRLGLWNGERLAIEQGPEPDRPNIVILKTAGDGSILIGGRSLIRIEGDYILH